MDETGLMAKSVSYRCGADTTVPSGMTHINFQVPHRSDLRFFFIRSSNEKEDF